MVRSKKERRERIRGQLPLRHRARWNREDDILLKELVKRGYHAGDIAAKMCRTDEGIKGRMRRLGISLKSVPRGQMSTKERDRGVDDTWEDFVGIRKIIAEEKPLTRGKKR